MNITRPISYNSQHNGQINSQSTVQGTPLSQSSNSFNDRTQSYYPPAGGDGDRVPQQWQPQHQQLTHQSIPLPPQLAPPMHPGYQPDQRQSLVQQPMYFPPPPTRPSPIPVSQPIPSQYQPPHIEQSKQPWQQHQQPHLQQPTFERTQPQFKAAQTYLPSTQAAPPPHDQSHGQTLVYDPRPSVNSIGYTDHKPLARPQQEHQPHPAYDRRATWSSSPLPSSIPPYDQNQYQQYSAPPHHGQSLPLPPPQARPHPPSNQQHRYSQDPSRSYQPHPQQWGATGHVPQQQQHQIQHRKSSFGLPSSTSAGVSSLTDKLSKFTISKKAKKLIGVGGGLLVGSLIGSEIGDIGEGIGDFFTGSEPEVGVYSNREDEGAGGEYWVENGAAGYEAAYGNQQGPTAMDFAGQNFMHESSMAGISSMHA